MKSKVSSELSVIYIGLKMNISKNLNIGKYMKEFNKFSEYETIILEMRAHQQK